MLRHQQAQPFHAVHAALPAQVQIALSEVRLLYHEQYLPLPAISIRAPAPARHRKRSRSLSWIYQRVL